MKARMGAPHHTAGETSLVHCPAACTTPESSDMLDHFQRQLLRDVEDLA